MWHYVCVLFFVAVLSIAFFWSRVSQDGLGTGGVFTGGPDNEIISKKCFVDLEERWKVIDEDEKQSTTEC